MPFWFAAALFLLALFGIFFSRRYLSKPVQTACIIGCTLLALACVIYLGLTLLFVDAVSHHPPAP